MRKTGLFLLLLTLAGCSTAPAIEEISQVASAPVIEQVTYRTEQERYLVVYPELHFRAPDGNVVAIHRDIVSYDLPAPPASFVSDTLIDISPQQQKKGAVYAVGWPCGPDHYHLQLRAYLIDSNHAHSNSVDYFITCSGT